MKISIKQMTRITDPKTMEKLVKAALESHEDLARPQFKRLDRDEYMPTPNRPKTPNEILALAFERNEARKKESNVSDD
jgi:hypothetical protein